MESKRRGLILNHSCKKTICASVDDENVSPISDMFGKINRFNLSFVFAGDCSTICSILLIVVFVSDEEVVTGVAGNEWFFIFTDDDMVSAAKDFWLMFCNLTCWSLDGDDGEDDGFVYSFVLDSSVSFPSSSLFSFILWD